MNVLIKNVICPHNTCVAMYEWDLCRKINSLDWFFTRWYLVLLSKENCDLFPMRNILKRSSNMSFEWAWYEGPTYQNIRNKIYMKGLVITDERAWVLLTDSKDAKWYVYVVKEEYRNPLTEINTDNVLVILKCENVWERWDTKIILLFIKSEAYDKYYLSYLDKYHLEINSLKKLQQNRDRQNIWF